NEHSRGNETRNWPMVAGSNSFCERFGTRNRPGYKRNARLRNGSHKNDEGKTERRNSVDWFCWKSVHHFVLLRAGTGFKKFDNAKEFCFIKPVEAHELLQKITDTTILYLKEKVKAGVNAVQVFDSWGGMLSPTDYQEFSWKYMQQIIDALKDETPVIA